MTAFHNPYHFVPIHEEQKPDDRLRRDAGPLAEDFRKQGLRSHDGRLAHDRYQGLSGRVLVKLTTATPLVVGGQQNRPNDDDYALVEPYRFKGEPAIPATSLKGMVGSLIEAASHSAMRVMADTKPVSWRQPMGKALSALGRIERDKETGKLQLRPLTVPNGTLSGQKIRFGDKHTLWCRVFAGYGNFKVHINPPTTVPERNRVSFMRLWPGGPFRDGQAPDVFDPHPSRKKPSLVLGQRHKGAALSHAAYCKYRDAGQDTSGYVRGLVRVLGKHDRPDIPNNKYHELFIPYPTDIKQRVAALPIPDHVIDAFHAMADERTAEQAERAKKRKETLSLRQRLPYLPFGTDEEEKEDRVSKEDDKEGPRIWARLRPGQIVYFDVGVDAKNQLEVSAISFSAIWRGLATRDGAPASLRDFVPEELRPMNPARTTITPAEWLLGFVEEGAGQQAVGTPEKKTTHHAAYAGRLRFSMACLADPAEADAPGFWEVGDGPEGRVKLKTLGSPKPPSPQLYFEEHANPGTVIAKETLRLDRHRAKGRKMHLHQDPTDKPWETRVTGQDEADQARLKNAVRPIATGQSFWFHVDFDNLSEPELQLLCFALRPTAAFRHKLGMGKGIGLGSVRLDPQALCLIDRKTRYTTTTDLLASPRYSTITREPDADPATWPTRLWPREATEAAAAAAAGEASPTARAATWRATIAAADNYPDIEHALRLIGEGLEHQVAPVHAPLTDQQHAGQANAEKETFGWFANNAEHIAKANRGGTPEQLKGLRKAAGKLPTLKKLGRPPRR